MKVAIYGKEITQDSRKQLELLYNKLVNAGVSICVNKKFNEFLESHCDMNLGFNTYASHITFKESKPDVLTYTYPADHGFNCDHRKQYNK